MSWQKMFALPFVVLSIVMHWTILFSLPQDVMVVGEPSLMGGEFGDEDERLITRLENTQYEGEPVEWNPPPASPAKTPPATHWQQYMYLYLHTRGGLLFTVSCIYLVIYETEMFSVCLTLRFYSSVTYKTNIWNIPAIFFFQYYLFLIKS